MGILEIILLPVTLPLAIIRGFFPNKPSTHGTKSFPKNDPRFSRYTINSRGQVLRVHKWLLPSSLPSNGIVFLCHGYNEHLGGRYDHIADYFNNNGYDVVGIDHAGHGGSEGKRAMVYKFDDLVSDYLAFAREVVEALPEEKRSSPSYQKVLLGNSMGGCISVMTASRDPSLFTQVVLCGPMLMLDPVKVGPVMIAIAHVLKRIVPWLPLGTVKYEDCTNDENVMLVYKTDPIPSHIGVTAATGAELTTAISRLPPLLKTFQTPFAIFHGHDDIVTLPKGSQIMYDASPLPVSKKALVLYPGVKHDILRETDWAHVMGDVCSWLKKQRSSS